MRMVRKPVFDGSKSAVERCGNPWNGRCGNTDILLYICHGGERFPICEKCWIEICESELEWGEVVGVKRVGRRC